MQINIVSDILSSGKVNYWTGDQTRQFETEFSKWCGSSFSIALANGSLALSSALSFTLGPEPWRMKLLLPTYLYCY